MKNILLYIPNNNFDRTAFLTVRKSLNRNGLNLFIVSDSNNIATGSGGLKIQPDVNYFNVNPLNFNGLIILGNEKAENSNHNSILETLIKKFVSNEKIILTIKSGSVLLAKSTSLKGKIASSEICKPLFVKTGFTPVDSDIVDSGNIYSVRNDGSIDDTIRMITSKKDKVQSKKLMNCC